MAEQLKLERLKLTKIRFNDLIPLDFREIFEFHQNLALANDKTVVVIIILSKFKKF